RPPGPRLTREWKMTMTAIDRSNSHGRGWRLTRLRLAKIVIDVAIAIGAVFAAFLLRFDGNIQGFKPVAVGVLFSLALKAIAYIISGLHRRSWSNLTFRDIGGLLGLGAFVAVSGTLLLVLFGIQVGIPRSIAVLDAVMTVMGMAAVR